MPRPGLRRPGLPSRWGLLHRRRRSYVPTSIGGLGWTEDGGGPRDDEGGGLAGVREPRRPKPAPPSMTAALPVPVGEAADEAAEELAG